jgi:hypothetical protein
MLCDSMPALSLPLTLYTFSFSAFGPPATATPILGGRRAVATSCDEMFPQMVGASGQRNMIQGRKRRILAGRPSYSGRQGKFFFLEAGVFI